MYDVIILGGGAAGLMAAQILSAKNRKVLILEAKNRLGGRIFPVHDFSFPSEGGAEFIHGNLKTTFDLIKEAHLHKKKVKGIFCKVENGKWSSKDQAVPGWELLMQKMKSFNENVSVNEFLSTSFKAEKYTPLINYFRKYVEGYDAADPANTSILAIKKEMEAEDEPQYRPLPDYYALIDFLKETYIKNGGVIKTNAAVTKVCRHENIEVFTSQREYFSKKIICAVPLGVLQSFRKQKSFIEFPDFLNSRLKAARKIGNGSVIKFLLEFDKAFWLENSFLRDKNIQAPSYIFSDAAIPTWWTQLPSKKPLLTGWLAGPSSYKMRNYSIIKFQYLMMESLSSIFKMPIENLKKRLKRFRVINWIKEDYFLGGYSYPTLETREARKILQQPFEKQFYFAGEYLPENSSSTVDSALLSGKLAAEQILKS